MSDLPTQGAFQQMHARPVSGEHLEVLGKQAAAKWRSGDCSTLTEAVVETVKHANLSPEQVKRVVEFTNTDAYLSEFKKEGADKFVDFGSGGPADSASILQDLNDGGGSVFDRGTLDYDAPPAQTKHASAYADGLFEREFSKTAAPLPEHDPYSEVMEFRDKLAGAYDVQSHQIDQLELQYAEDSDRAYQAVKQAALNGQSLGEVVQAWSSIAPSTEHVKVAFQLFTPRLIREGVFPSLTALHNSLAKTASLTKVAEQGHPVVLNFGAYCDTLSKLAEVREARGVVKGHLDGLTSYLMKAAAEGLIPKAWGVAKNVAQRSGDFVAPHADKLLQGSGKYVGGALKYAPHAALAIAANEARLHAQNDPQVQGALSVVPGTQAYNYRQMMMQQGY